jgi:3-oxoacyl-[acyl-carrier protein] reductase
MSNKQILIIGGNSGIGKRVKELLETNPSNEIIIASRSAETNPATSSYQLDILEPEPAFPEIDELHGLVYCPGSIQLKPFKQLKMTDIQDDLEVNVFGLIKTLKFYEQALKKQGASVVGFSTIAVSQGMPFHSSVALSKAGLEGVVRSLAAEWAPTVRLNVVAPSLTDTPMASRLLRNDKQREASEQRHPLKRIGTPNDIAGAAEFLLSDNSSWMSGQVLHVDGGLSALRV